MRFIECQLNSRASVNFERHHSTPTSPFRPFKSSQLNQRQSLYSGSCPMQPDFTNPKNVEKDDENLLKKKNAQIRTASAPIPSIPERERETHTMVAIVLFNKSVINQRLNLLNVSLELLNFQNE